MPNVPAAFPTKLLPTLETVGGINVCMSGVGRMKHPAWICFTPFLGLIFGKYFNFSSANCLLGPEVWQSIEVCLLVFAG